MFDSHKRIDRLEATVKRLESRIEYLESHKNAARVFCADHHNIVPDALRASLPASTVIDMILQHLGLELHGQKQQPAQLVALEKKRK